MSRVPHCLIVALAAALAAGGLAAAGLAAEPADSRLAVRIVPHDAPAPAAVRIIASVDPSPDDRTLTFEIESPSLFRSDEQPLDGERAARTHAVLFEHLPAGQYQVRVRLTSTDGDVVVTREFYSRAESDPGS
jgi:hypothetical protein